MVWYSHLFKSFPQFIMIHTVKGFGIINETEIDVFLEFPSFLYDPENVITIEQSHSSPVLVRSRLKLCMLGFSIMWTKNFQMSKLGLEKEEEPKIKLPGITDS